MTQGEPDDDHPEGSVGRYVRERWGADVSERRSRRRASAVVAPPPAPPAPRAAPVEELRPTSTPPWGVGVDETAFDETVLDEPEMPSGRPPGGTGSGRAVPDEWPPDESLPDESLLDEPLPDEPLPDEPESTGAHAARPYVAVPRVAPDVPVARLGEPPNPDRANPDRANPDRANPDRTTSDRNGPAPAPRRHGPTASPATPPRGARWVDPQAVAAQEAQRARSGAVASGLAGPGPGSSDLPADLSSARLLRPTKRPPQSGWRRLVYVLSGRLVNPGESPADVRRRELIARVNAPLLGCHKIALLSLKGGVGKTTMTATLGATFASLRGDRVVAVDANPDRGTLSQKIPLETSATVRNLLRDAQRVRRYTDVRAYTSQGTSRLEVLASEQDPAVSEAFSEEDYRRTVTLLEHFYNMVLTDCGTGLMHSAMYGVLGVADQIVVVSSGSIDGARSASATLDWLDAHGHGDLVRNAVAVINCVSRSAGGVDLDRVAAHFGGRCRAVVRIPFDAHLQEGAEVDLDRLEPRTRLALLELAAVVADAFPA
jgi:MinD-like ATPase involved in chromosome partitioning or flagellar assembly